MHLRARARLLLTFSRGLLRRLLSRRLWRLRLRAAALKSVRRSQEGQQRERAGQSPHWQRPAASPVRTRAGPLPLLLCICRSCSARTLTDSSGQLRAAPPRAYNFRIFSARGLRFGESLTAQPVNCVTSDGAQNDRTLRDSPPPGRRRQRRGLPGQRHAAAAARGAQDSARRPALRRADALHRAARGAPGLGHRAPQRLRHLRSRRERRRRLHRHAVRARPVARPAHRARARPACNWCSPSAFRSPTDSRPRTRSASSIAT